MDTFIVDGVECKSIAGYDAYCVGKDGLPRSCWKRGGHERIKLTTWRTMKGIKDQDGYCLVNLYDDSGKTKTHKVHRLVLEAFVGEAPAGCVCCHNNGNCQDNRLENLRWDTYAENEADRAKHGTRVGPAGELHGLAKLNDAVVRKILMRHQQGETQAELAVRFNISRSNVGLIVTRKAWKHVKAESLNDRLVSEGLAQPYMV